MVWSKKIQREIRRNRLKGALLLSGTLFLGLSFFSYKPQDPSLNFFGSSLKVENYCGFIGASLADLFYQFFGFSSWFFILGGLILAYKFFTGRLRESAIESSLFFGLFVLSFMSLSELYFSEVRFFNHSVSWGGGLGKVIISSLKPLFHTTGTAVLLWSSLAVIFIFYSPTVFLRAFGLWPIKILITFWKLFKVSPHIIGKAGLKVKKGIQKLSNFLKLSLSFFGKIFSFIRKLKHSETPSPKALDSQINKTKEAPQFVFQDKSFLHKEKEPPPSQSLMAPKIEKPFLHKKSFDKGQLPSVDILSDIPQKPEKIHRQDVEELSKKLIDKLSQFSIQGEIKAIKTGPALVLFEFKPENHVKVSRIREMESDLSLALSSESVRIIAPIPGRDVVGIEASMPYRKMVHLKNLLRSESFFKADLPLVLGRRADNVIGIKDLARIPHLLVAGTTGSGKSMFIISFVISLLFRHSPDSLKILLIDPKQVDLSAFKDIPHLLSPIITSSHLAVQALHWAVMEMEKRYRSLALFQARDHKSFNTVARGLSSKEKSLHSKKQESARPQDSYYFEPLPLICIVIEEFGDLMADKNIRRPLESAVVRLAQKARASGIHLILAMQSPRKDVVTGLIKTNIPGRISFKVASGTDSRVILDETGAEKLLSHGDMLFLEPGHIKALRYHGPFVRERDVEEVGNHWRSQAEPIYEKALIPGSAQLAHNTVDSSMNIKEDPMYDEILEFVKTCDVVSASFLQRKFRIGYPRAARMIEILFEEGQIGPPQGSKPREVLAHK